MPKSRFLLCLLTFAVLGAGRCSTVPKGESASSGLSSPLTILYQQGREGQIEPCGCHSSPYGGIDRELNAVRAIRKQSPAVLFVDAGNLFSPTTGKIVPELYRKRGEALTGALNEMGLDVFGPGPSDFALGMDFLRKVQGQAKFKFVSTNVVDAKGKPIFPTFQIIDVAGTPVAVFSLIDESVKLGGGLKTVNAKTALTKALEEVGSKAKLTVVLSNLGQHTRDMKFIEEVPAANIVIGNDPGLTLQRGDPRGTSLVVDGHRFGYFLGKFQVELAYPIKGFYSQALITANKEALTGYEAALAVVTKPEKRAALESQIADFKKKQVLEAAPGASRFENTLVALSEEAYGTKNELTAVMLAEKDRVKNAAIDAAPAAPKTKAKK